MYQRATNSLMTDIREGDADVCARAAGCFYKRLVFLFQRDVLNSSQKSNRVLATPLAAAIPRLRGTHYHLCVQHSAWSAGGAQRSARSAQRAALSAQHRTARVLLCMYSTCSTTVRIHLFSPWNMLHTFYFYS